MKTSQLIPLSTFQGVINRALISGLIWTPTWPVVWRRAFTGSFAIRTSHTLHHESPRCRRIQCRQFLGAEPPRHDKSAEGDQEQDDDGKADGRDGLRDSKRRSEAQQLDADEHPDREASLDSFQGIRRRGQLLVACQKEQLQRNAVARERLAAHDEEQACEHALRDEVQHDQERACHGDEEKEALREVADALLDDVVCYAGDFALVRFFGVGHEFRDAETVCVEGRLWDEAVGERDAEDASDKGC